MWNPFRRQALLGDDDTQFQIECYKWLLRHFGGDEFYVRAKLVLPTKDYFPTVVSSSESAASTTFNQVKKYAGMEEWPVRLEAQSEDPDLHVAPTVLVRDVERSPLGTFSTRENSETVITYNPAIVADPTQMVATFAHELSHYLTGTASEPPPGGWENWEFATDIGATFMGFGIFQANAAFSFRQYVGVDSIGWKSSRSGYLSEAEHSYSLAIFLLLKGIPAESAYPYCDANVKSYLRRALRELAANDVICELRAIT
ncbi:MAG: hypothetical protein ABI866_00870 [Dokdonella sp.]